MFLEYVNRILESSKPTTGTAAVPTDSTSPPPNYPVVYNTLETGWTVDRPDTNTEGLKSYENHECCPIVIGDILSGCNISNPTKKTEEADPSDEECQDCPEENQARFKVVEKLGHGAYATVWLARDLNHAHLARSSSSLSLSEKSSSSLSLASMLTANPIAQYLLPPSATGGASIAASSLPSLRLRSGRRGHDQQHALRSYIENNKMGKLIQKTPKTHSKYVAIKVLRLTASDPNNKEMRTLQKLGKLQCAFFHTNSRSGLKYLCLVTAPMGRTLDIRIPFVSQCMRDLQGITAFIKVLVEKIFDLHQKGFTHGGMYLSPCSPFLPYLTPPPPPVAPSALRMLDY